MNLCMNIHKTTTKKSHTYKEDGAYLRISVWHLLMNLKNIYIYKLLKWANKKCKNFDIYNVMFFFFFEKKKKYILHLCTKNLDNMIYCSWDIQCDRPKLIITGHLLSFHISYGSWDMLWDRQNFFSFWTIFCPFTPTPPPPLRTQKIKILIKREKKQLEISSFYTSVP